MDLGLHGKVALVAAASKGLGFGVAQTLAREGAKVSICSRSQGEVEAAAQKLRDETGADVIATACDVTKPAHIQNWVDKTVAQWGVVDALLVNAGGPPGGLLKDFTDEQWQAAFELTLMSTVRMIRATLPHMKNGGAILTVTSSSVKEPIERLGLSTVMRSGVVGLVKTLADELSPNNIRVNNLIPGRIDTDRVAALDSAAAQRTGKSVEEVRADSISKIPLKRLGTIEDFGTAGAFLLSPAASYITGSTLRVDGGAMRSVSG
jgi:3-oxoacyl-[acyl-carrier protein] reductase